jgi:hypothetical protein
MSGRYTNEMHEQYRVEQNEKAAKVERERRERWDEENVRRAYLAEGGTEEKTPSWSTMRSGRCSALEMAALPSQESTPTGAASKP